MPMGLALLRAGRGGAALVPILMTALAAGLGLFRSRSVATSRVTSGVPDGDCNSWGACHLDLLNPHRVAGAVWACGEIAESSQRSDDGITYLTFGLTSNVVAGSVRCRFFRDA